MYSFFRKENHVVIDKIDKSPDKADKSICADSFSFLTSRKGIQSVPFSPDVVC